MTRPVRDMPAFGAAAGGRPEIAYVFDPRFPGGTSAAIAAELGVAARMGRLSLHARRSAMFRGDQVAPALREALDRLGLGLIWDAPEIGADLVVLHNPSFLKFQAELGARIAARRLVVVTHENFLRPGGAEGFDVGHCLATIDRAALALDKVIAPVSAHNRATVRDWFAANPEAARWPVLDADWFNICDFPLLPPTDRPRDRRGRHSRPGGEKFPALADLDACFPPKAEANVILGADGLAEAGVQRPHWSLHPFRTLDVAEYFAMIDFMVYFTAPTWRESFGRVIAEAIAAGKVVICDAQTGSAFGDAVVTATPAEVDGVIADLVARPDRYRAQVLKGQARLAGFSADAFGRHFAAMLAGSVGGR